MLVLINYLSRPKKGNFHTGKSLNKHRQELCKTFQRTPKKWKHVVSENHIFAIYDVMPTKILLRKLGTLATKRAVLLECYDKKGISKEIETTAK